ncbi:shikimate dehydrogenase [Tessaracoccus sp. OS52]|uniref:shikimate dehydrogenase family protein n=1 Tax=Tessaracoccus sp. OS52 TaxID=2886691 RepID=UPI001D123161|nr:shikimate dehydrogenase [Tessaracoccus sp. OS52]MCC2592969.1 shikimate dehydrogenase [Tessaracoccus sp. OS52]
MRCAVIGDPAAHSLSPAIHRAGYARHGLDWTYEAITVTPEGLDAFVTEVLADDDWAGLSVTAPHKEAICRFGEPDHVTRLVGGGNTLVKGQAPTVHNTDVPGFVRAWRHYGLGPLRRAAIVGNGATARSLMVALAGLDVAEVLVLARRPERAGSLVELGLALGTAVEAVAIDEELPEVDLLASTVPTEATAPHAARWAKAASVLFDAVYHPWPTPMAGAAAPGQTVITGLDLLAGQAVDQFYLLTGHEVTFADCLSAAQDELRSRHATVEE